MHGVHVLRDVASEDALTVVVSGILLGIRVVTVTVELLLVVRDLETTIEGTLLTPMVLWGFDYPPQVHHAHATRLPHIKDTNAIPASVRHRCVFS